MCACDETRGGKFLPHQLKYGAELETNREVLVNGGFLPKICRECRGQPLDAHPKAELYGSASKIKRYYWRELMFREMEIYEEWRLDNGVEEDDFGEEANAAREAAGRQALSEIKELHQRSPKYVYRDESQSTVIAECNVNVVDLSGEYVKVPSQRKAMISDGNSLVTAEEFATRYFQGLGYSVLEVESVPFHVLFGVYMWLVIQDVGDPLRRLSGFGSRTAFEQAEEDKVIWTPLPEDFGKKGFSRRRKKEIEEHLSPKNFREDDLEWLFDYWLGPSSDLREYLWAHRGKDVATAREIIQILPFDVVRGILLYLVDDYWRNYLGWPDLLVYKESEFVFVEIKSSGDKLSIEQMRWIRDNAKVLKLPFKLVKIHRR